MIFSPEGKKSPIFFPTSPPKFSEGEFGRRPVSSYSFLFSECRTNVFLFLDPFFGDMFFPSRSPRSPKKSSRAPIFGFPLGKNISDIFSGKRKIEGGPISDRGPRGDFSFRRLPSKIAPWAPDLRSGAPAILDGRRASPPISLKSEETSLLVLFPLRPAGPPRDRKKKDGFSPYSFGVGGNIGELGKSMIPRKSMLFRGIFDWGPAGNFGGTKEIAGNFGGTEVNMFFLTTFFPRNL